MSQTRYTNMTEELTCEECDKTVTVDVEIDKLANIAAFTCPECGTTQEP